MIKLLIFLVISTSSLLGMNTNYSLTMDLFPEVCRYLEEIECDDYSIRHFETLVDFDDNYYILFQFKPSGYVIFDQKTKGMIEGSFEVNSPYQNVKVKGSKYYDDGLGWMICRDCKYKTNVSINIIDESVR